MGRRYEFSMFTKTLKEQLQVQPGEMGRGNDGNLQVPCSLHTKTGELLGYFCFWCSKGGIPGARNTLQRFINYLPEYIRKEVDPVAGQGVRVVLLEELPAEWREYFKNYGYSRSPEPGKDPLPYSVSPFRRT